MICKAIVLYTLLAMAPGTQIVSARYGPEYVTKVSRGNDYIGVFTDGFICYGTNEPRTASCHRAIPKPPDIPIEPVHSRALTLYTKILSPSSN